MESKEKTNQAESLPTKAVNDLPVPDEQTDQARGGLRFRVVELTTAPPPVG